MTAISRKKSGFPSTTLYEDAQNVHLFSKISSNFIASHEFQGTKKLDALSLAKVSFQLLNFMETTLGKSAAASTRTTTKIPISAFRDYSTNGSLMNILLEAMRYKNQAGWETFDLSPADRSADGVKIIQSIEAVLIEVQ
jgi:hypothetical protein